MESRENNASWYLNIDGKRISVSCEIYRMIRREDDRVWRQAHKESRCTQKSYARCWGDCQSCRWHTNGRFDTYSLIEDDHVDVMVSSLDVEAEVLSHLTMEKVYAVADTIVPQGGQIMRLRFEENLSNREISVLLGVGHSTLDYRLKKLIRYIRENAKLFF